MPKETTNRVFTKAREHAPYQKYKEKLDEQREQHNACLDTTQDFVTEYLRPNNRDRISNMKMFNDFYDLFEMICVRELSTWISQKMSWPLDVAFDFVRCEGEAQQRFPQDTCFQRTVLCAEKLDEVVRKRVNKFMNMIIVVELDDNDKQWSDLSDTDLKLKTFKRTYDDLLGCVSEWRRGRRIPRAFCIAVVQASLDFMITYTSKKKVPFFNQALEYIKDIATKYTDKIV